jgi:hypothetical protein
MAGMSDAPSANVGEPRGEQAGQLLTLLERDVGLRVAYGWDDSCWVESARLVGHFPTTELVLIVRRASRPDCQYGFRARVWRDDGRLMSDDPGGWSTVEGYAGILGIHLDEIIHAGEGGLPDDCPEGEVVWPIDRLGGTYWGLGTDLPRFPPPVEGDILVLQSSELARVVEVLENGRIRAEVWDHSSLRAVVQVIDRSVVESSLGHRFPFGSDPPGPEADALRAWLGGSG